jgi:hypothetical protein
MKRKVSEKMCAQWYGKERAAAAEGVKKIA